MSTDDFLFTIEDINVYKEDLETFQYGNWLTDNAISFALEYINTGLSPIVREGYRIVHPCFTEAIKHCEDSEIPIFLGDAAELKEKIALIVVSDNSNADQPLGGQHWTLLVWDGHTKGFYFFNSLDCVYDHWVEKIAGRLAKFVMGSDFLWEIQSVDGPKQQSGSDCGMFVIEVCRTLMQFSLDELKNINMDPEAIRKKRKEWIERANEVRNAIQKGGSSPISTQRLDDDRPQKQTSVKEEALDITDVYDKVTVDSIEKSCDNAGHRYSRLEEIHTIVEHNSSDDIKKERHEEHEFRGVLEQ